MKIQRVLFKFSERGQSFWGAAVVGSFDGAIKYIIGEHDGLKIYTEWYDANLNYGPLAYMDTVPLPQIQSNPAKEET